MPRIGASRSAGARSAVIPPIATAGSPISAAMDASAAVRSGPIPAGAPALVVVSCTGPIPTRSTRPVPVAASRRDPAIENSAGLPADSPTSGSGPSTARTFSTGSSVWPTWTWTSRPSARSDFTTSSRSSTNTATGRSDDATGVASGPEAVPGSEAVAGSESAAGLMDRPVASIAAMVSRVSAATSASEACLSRIWTIPTPPATASAAVCGTVRPAAAHCSVSVTRYRLQSYGARRAGGVRLVWAAAVVAAAGSGVVIDVSFPRSRP